MLEVKIIARRYSDYYILNNNYIILYKKTYYI